MTREQVVEAVDFTEPADPPPPPPPERVHTIELTLAPEDAAAFGRRRDLARAAPSRPVRLIWMDDPESSLANVGQIIGRTGRLWRVEALEPGHAADWPPCSPEPILDEALSADALRQTPPFDATPVAAFDGRRNHYRRGEVSIDLLHGSFRGLLDNRPACRLRLSGPATDIAATLAALTEFRIGVPRAALAREALAVAKGSPLPPRHLGGPALDADTGLSDGLSRIIGHLLDALLYWTDLYQRDARVEAVHQGRVATRRLRSALSLYKHALPSAELTEANAALQHCAATLGAARDWDVFLLGAGTRVEEAAATDTRMAALLRAAKRRRQLAHAELSAFLAGPAFRRLELALGLAASLRPWERGMDHETLTIATADFAASALERRSKRVRRRGRSLDTLPLPELHEFRKDCKRLRYAAEFFAPAFPAKSVKPFLKKLAALQEELGTLNDTAVVSHLMAQLGRAGGGYAAGVVEGWASVAAHPVRRRIMQKWKQFRSESPFWTV